MNTGIPASQAKQTVDSLQKILANQHILYQRLRNFHWNITGPQFGPLHKLFESFYTDFIEDIDEIAERIRALGGTAAGTFTEYLSTADLKEQPGKVPGSSDMLKQLLADYETLIQGIRRSCSGADDATQSMLTALLEKLEKQAWMIRATIA